MTVLEKSLIEFFQYLSTSLHTLPSARLFTPARCEHSEVQSHRSCQIPVMDEFRRYAHARVIADLTNIIIIIIIIIIIWLFKYSAYAMIKYSKALNSYKFMLIDKYTILTVFWQNVFRQNVRMPPELFRTLMWQCSVAFH